VPVSRSASTGQFWKATVDAAAAKVHAGAYLHWYAAHGCSRELITDAIDTMADVAGSYRHLLA